jgi:hypothetical protein
LHDGLETAPGAARKFTKRAIRNGNLASYRTVSCGWYADDKASTHLSDIVTQIISACSHLRRDNSSQLT